MFSSLEQWVQSLGKKNLPEHLFTKINFEDVQEVVQLLEDTPPLIMQKIEKNHINREEEEEGDIDEEEDVADSSLCKPVLITTIPLSFFVETCGYKNYDTLPLIKGTLQPELEEYYINHILDTLDSDELHDILIILYGQNATDSSVFEKAKQLRLLGFLNIYIYSGGMFEWCLLQDVYGNKEFPISTSKTVEPLQYKGKRIFHP